MFDRRMYDEVAGQVEDAPDWPFASDSVPFLDAYGPFRQTPKGLTQDTNCRRALELYLASRLTFEDFLRLQRKLIEVVSRRIVGFVELANSPAESRIPNSHAWIALKTVHDSVTELLEFMGKDVQDAENRRIFEQEPIWGAESMVDCFLGRAVLGADAMDKQAAELFGVEPANIFELVAGEAAVVAAEAPDHRPIL